LNIGSSRVKEIKKGATRLESHLFTPPILSNPSKKVKEMDYWEFYNKFIMARRMRRSFVRQLRMNYIFLFYKVIKKVIAMSDNNDTGQYEQSS